MPNLDDIATIADALEKGGVAVIQDRCVAVRNRNARCRRCVAACAQGAIAVSGNEVHYDPRRCVACGACAGACPTDALVPLKPTDSVIDAEAQAVRDNTGELCAFACDRMSARQVGDPQKYVHVPCLARVDEVVVLEQIAAGARHVMLIDANCSTCKYRFADDGIQRVVDALNGLPVGEGARFLVERASEFPDELLVGDGSGKFGSTRRGFFSDAAAAAKETALTAARVSLQQKLAISEEPAAIGERLRVGEGGTMPRIQTPRHEGAINALYEMGLADVEDGEVASRLFGSVSMDFAKCNACGMCVTFCPTGALSRGDAGGARDPLSVIEFSASSCVQCGLCADACWKGCITVSDTVSCSQLFDFEPTVFELPEAGMRAGW